MSTEALLPGVPDAVNEILRHLEDGQSVQVLGPPMAGKSSALAETAKQLRARGKRPVHVEAPAGADDEALVVLVGVATQLGELDADVVACVKDPKQAWHQKVDKVSATLKRHEIDIVLIFDELTLRAPAMLPERAVRSTSDLLSHFISERIPTVVASPRPVPFLRARDVSIKAASNPADVLGKASWNGLGEFATALLERGGERLSSKSPLELRLSVALLASGVETNDFLGWSPPTLAGMLFRKLGRSDALLELVRDLAVLRTPFDETWPRMLERARLSHSDRQIFDHALLYGSPGALRLHEILQREARLFDWGPATRTREEVHRLAAKYHEAKYLDAVRSHDVCGAARHEMEVVHHLTCAGALDEVMTAQVYFGEQYDLLGKTLSLAGRYDDAVRCYERALECDEEDAYAHHYLAYNLDILARDPDRIGRGYEEAIRWRPEHPWYHGRYVCFLIARGERDRARGAWESALTTLFPGGPDDQPDLYRELHRPVARLLLHRGQLEWADRVLADVPQPHRTEPWFRSLCRLHAILDEAEREESVFPPHLPLAERWNGPHLYAGNVEEEVKAWSPAYVAAVDDEVHLRTARREEGGEIYGWRDIPLKHFKKMAGSPYYLALRAGTYVELITLTSGGEIVLAHTSTELHDENLPGVFPRSDRYLRGTA